MGWVDGIVRGGAMVISIYLWHSEGLSDRNRTILDAAAEAIRRFGGPWLMAGDFNMTPQDLRDGMEAWLDKLGGKVIAPPEPTCRSKLGGRTIDFAVIDVRIEAAVQGIWVDYGVKASPHSVVRIRLRTRGTRDMVRRLKKPRAFPSDRPVGCPRAPKAPDQQVMEDLRSTASRWDGAKDFRPFNAALKHLVELAEEELCDMCDCVKDDGGPDGSYLGRAKPRYVWSNAVPVAGKEAGRADATNVGLSTGLASRTNL